MEQGPRLVADIEGNGLLYEVTKIYLICTMDVNTKKTRVFHNQPCFHRHGTVQQGIQYLNTAKQVIGHNFSGYDLPAIEKLNPEISFLSRMLVPKGLYCYDTLMASRILYPERKKHSLESWFGEEKIQNHDWVELTQLIIDRCVGDVEMTYKLMVKFVTKCQVEGFDILEALKAEAGDQYLQSRQEKAGVLVDAVEGVKLWEEIQDTLAKDARAILEMAPKVCKPVSKSKVPLKAVCDLFTSLSGLKSHPKDPEEKIGSWVANIRNAPPKPKHIKKVFLKDRSTYTAQVKKEFGTFLPGTNLRGPCSTLVGKGGYSSQVTKHFNPVELVEANVLGPFTRIQFETMNLGSGEQMKKFLYSLGWVPTEYNFKSVNGHQVRMSPKLTEDSYDSLTDETLGPIVKEYQIASHRSKFLYSVVKRTGLPGGVLSLIRDDGRAPAGGIVCGTPTARLKHRGIANVPKPGKYKGTEIRSLFRVASGNWFLGVDLSGIEARMMAHFAAKFAGGDELIRLVLSEQPNDFHTNNANAWGVDRDTAKTLVYALMYGASGKKLAVQAGRSESQGKQIKDEFYHANPALAMLVKELDALWDAGNRHIIGLDGRPVFVRSKHKLLNCKLQGSASVVFKRWKANCHIHIPEFVSHQVWMILNVHDEINMESVLSKEHTEEVGKHVVRMAEITGQEFGLNLPIGAAALVGKNWCECH